MLRFEGKNVFPHANQHREQRRRQRQEGGFFAGPRRKRTIRHKSLDEGAASPARFCHQSLGREGKNGRASEQKEEEEVQVPETPYYVRTTQPIISHGRKKERMEQTRSPLWLLHGIIFITDLEFFCSEITGIN